MKRKVKFLAILCMGLVLITTYFLRLRYSLWYDEAAVVENASNSSVSDLRNGLNWLQTIPPGYFLAAKIILSFPFGVEILRTTSLISVLLGTYIAARFLTPSKLGINSKILVSCLLLINPVSVTYATMVKPYGLEFLLGILAVYFYKYSYWRALSVTAFVGPLFSNSTYFLVGSIAFLLFIKREKLRIALKLLTLGCSSTLISYYFTADGTKKLMKSVWFGDSITLGLPSFKSAIGNLSWLPVSGIGILPEGGSGKTYLLLSLGVLALLLGIVATYKSEMTGILFIVLTFFIISQTFLLVPAAGRLMLAPSALVLLILVIRINEYGHILKNFCLVVLVVVSLICNLSSHSLLKSGGNSRVKEVFESIDVSNIDGTVYANLWAGPATRFYLKESRNRLSSNTIWVGEDNHLLGCQRSELRAGDLLVLDFISPASLVELSKNPHLRALNIDQSTGVFYITDDFRVESVESPQTILSCEYSWSNPQRRM